MRLIIAISVFVIASLTGCGGSSDTAGKYDAVTIGMTTAQVEALLGPASGTAEELTGELKTWRLADGTQVAISFEDGKVKTKDRMKR